jgi:low temperature requirement protein LtrA
MPNRDPSEQHRAATSLELLFDLCFVAAVGQAAAQLDRFLVEGQTGRGVIAFAFVFFAIWWAWMNFTWFASAYDSDDVPYRLLVLVQIAGALILAAGVPRIMVQHDLTLGVTGYVVMRLALVAQWLRAGRDDPERRLTTFRYAAGVAFVESCWVVVVIVPHGAQRFLIPIFVLFELAVPPWAERTGSTTWHPHHIAERYGLFTLIMLGESVVAATTAIQSGSDQNGFNRSLFDVAVGGLLIVFGMWWIYFAVPAHGFLTSNRRVFIWGYGHYLIFGSAAAVGAGLGVAVAHGAGQQHASELVAAASVTIPVATYLITVWFLHLRPHAVTGLRSYATPAGAVVTLALTFAPDAVLLSGLVMAALVAAKVLYPPTQSAAATDSAAGEGEED